MCRCHFIIICKSTYMCGILLSLLYVIVRSLGVWVVLLRVTMNGCGVISFAGPTLFCPIIFLLANLRKARLKKMQKPWVLTHRVWLSCVSLLALKSQSRKFLLEKNYTLLL